MRTALLLFAVEPRRHGTCWRGCACSGAYRGCAFLGHQGFNSYIADDSGYACPMNFRASLRTVADVFAILTGLSFVLSAVIQEAVFAFWNLDFTSVGSVEDVVMGGIRLLSFGLLWGAIVAFPFYWVFATGDSSLAPRSGSWAERIRIIAILVVSGVLVIGFNYWMSVLPDDSIVTSVTLSTAAAFLFYGIFIAVIRLFTSPFGVLRHYQAVKEVRLTIRSVAPLAIAAAIIQSVLFYSVPTAQKISTVGGGRMKCKGEAAREPVIQWIGSRALVYSCHGRKEVLLLGEDSYILMRR